MSTAPICSTGSELSALLTPFIPRSEHHTATSIAPIAHASSGSSTLVSSGSETTIASMPRVALTTSAVSVPVSGNVGLHMEVVQCLWRA